MAETIYLLCTAMSALCMWLLFRSYRRTKVRLLFWSSAAFLAFTGTNLLLFVDLIILPTVDLSLYRTGLALFGVLLLLYGLIWDS